MAKQGTLTSPVTLDPRQVAKVRLVSAMMIFSNNALQLSYELLDSNGAVVDRKNVNVATAAVQTYVGNQEQQLLQALMTKLGLAGTIA